MTSEIVRLYINKHYDYILFCYFFNEHLKVEFAEYRF